MAGTGEWIPIFLILYADTFKRETEKAYEFCFFGKKKHYFPKSILDTYTTTEDGKYYLSVPLWYMRDEKNAFLKYFMEDKELKESLFPKKEKVKKQAEMPLLQGIPNVIEGLSAQSESVKPVREVADVPSDEKWF